MTTPANRESDEVRMESIVLRRKQVAALLNISLATLWRWQAQGFPRSVPLGPPGSRCVGYRKSDVDAWMANRGTC